MDAFIWEKLSVKEESTMFDEIAEIIIALIGFGVALIAIPVLFAAIVIAKITDAFRSEE